MDKASVRGLVHELESPSSNLDTSMQTRDQTSRDDEVVALGTGKRDEAGKEIPFVVKKGDKVLISKYGGTEIKVDGESYLIMREDDILGIIG